MRRVSFRTLRVEPTFAWRRRVSWKREVSSGQASIAWVMLTWRTGLAGSVLVSSSFTIADRSVLISSRSCWLEKTVSNVQNAAGAVFTNRPIARPNSKLPMSSSGTPYSTLELYLAWTSAEPCS